MAQMQQGMAAWRATGAEVDLPYFLALLAEANAKGGQVSDGLALLAEALVIAHRYTDVYWEPEVHRLKGEFLLQQAVAKDDEAEACFHQALAVARRQQAKSLELRAAMSLGRLWQRQGNREEARLLLAGSMTGSPMGLTSRTSEMPRRCSRNWREFLRRFGRLMRRAGMSTSPTRIRRRKTRTLALHRDPPAVQLDELPLQ